MLCMRAWAVALIPRRDDLGEDGVLPQMHQGQPGPLGDAELAASVTVVASTVTPSTSARGSELAPAIVCSAAWAGHASAVAANPDAIVTAASMSRPVAFSFRISWPFLDVA